MRILLVGGGSGGHVTPLKAVATALFKQIDKLDIIVVTDNSFYNQTKHIFQNNQKIVIKRLIAGKLRRYQGKSIMWHLYYLPVLFANLFDIVRVGIGFFQSLWLLIRVKPNVVFCKGGFVCLPLGFAARLFNIPLVIHDSDTLPGLTNRLLSRWAKLIAVGMPIEFYPYLRSKMHHIGMPVDEGYKPINAKMQSNLKEELGFSSHQPVLLVTGGGNGAKQLNSLISKIAPRLLNDGWGIVHLAGEGKTKSLIRLRQNMTTKNSNNWQIEGFAPMLNRLLAADVVVARTSASTLQECANAQKFLIGVPSQHLKDQKMNGDYFNKHKAIVLFDEAQEAAAKKLYECIKQSKLDQHKTDMVAHKLAKIASKSNAAQELAELIVSVAA